MVLIQPIKYKFPKSIANRSLTILLCSYWSISTNYQAFLQVRLSIKLSQPAVCHSGTLKHIFFKYNYIRTWINYQTYICPEYNFVPSYVSTHFYLIQVYAIKHLDLGRVVAVLHHRQYVALALMSVCVIQATIFILMECFQVAPAHPAILLVSCLYIQ